MTDLEADLKIAQARIQGLEKRMAGMVEVVRCKDCKWYYNADCNHPCGMYCPEPNDFCSEGGRRDKDG